MKILLLSALLTLGCAGCFSEPGPECPDICEAVHGLEGYLEGCYCPPEAFDNICRDDIAAEKEDWEKELEDRCEDL